MSKVAIQGNASGTGTFTIAAPNSNTDRTLTLPDEAGTVLTSGGAIDVNASAPADSVVIGASGNIGIGETAPSAKMHIKSSGSDLLDLERNGVGQYRLFISNSDALGVYDVGADSNRLVIDSSGETKFLGNNGASTFASYESNDGVIQTYESGQGWHHRCVGDYNGTKYALGCYYGNTLVGYISFSNTSTAYNTSSDYRLKENVVDMTGAIDRVKSLKPSQFNFITDPDTTVDGFLAHEVQGIVPEAVHGEKDAVDAEGNPEYQGIDQSKLVPLLTGALQEAIARIETLEAEVATLKGASA